MSYFILNVSDLHLGSLFALFPEGFMTSVGSILALNSGQQYLLECWEDVLSRIPDEIDVLTINGDVLDGDNKFEMARGLGEVDPLWQVRAAQVLLDPLVQRAKNIRFARGSGYHTGKGGTFEELLAERVGAEPDRRGHYAPPWWRFRFPGEDGVYFDLAHRQSTTIRYRSMPMERELDFCLNRFARRREAPPQDIVIIRSHTHAGYRLWHEDKNAWVISTPCMKLQDDFAKTRISPNRIIPDNVGLVGIWVHDDPGDGERITVEPYIYPHPEQGEVDVICA